MAQGVCNDSPSPPCRPVQAKRYQQDGYSQVKEDLSQPVYYGIPVLESGDASR